MPGKSDKIEHKDIALDDLVIDKCNMGGRPWDHDEGLIRSIKEGGVINALDVRPPKMEGKYRIFAGRRRYNASIEAGLTTVPCKVHYSMSDTEARALSFKENQHRDNRPEWLFIEWIGEIYEQMKFDMKLKGGMKERYVILEQLTGLNRKKISDYVRICLHLPEEVKALMRQREDRTSLQKELLLGLLYRSETPQNILSVDQALLILNEIGKFPTKKQVEVATHILTKKKGIALKIVKAVKINPESSMWDIDVLIRKKSKSKFKRRQINLGEKTFDTLSRLALTKQKPINVLAVWIIEDWLKTHLYLASK